MQRELLDTFEQMNHAWFARVQSEIDLAAEFIGKVAETRSIPDVATAGVHQPAVRDAYRG
jgi:hypothetical protein